MMTYVHRSTDADWSPLPRMILFDFEYDRPRTWQQAAVLLRDSGGKARALAGGTDLLPNMRVEIIKPERLISLSGVEVAAPRVEEDGSIRIDALTRLCDIERCNLLRATLPMLCESAHSVASNQIRQMGTLGGNLCQDSRCLYLNQEHDFQFVADCYKRGGDCCYPFPKNDRETCWSVYMSDVAPVLIAMNAEVEILGVEGTRRMALQELFTGDGLKPHRLGAGELLSAAIVPAPSEGFAWGYHKTTIRGGLEFGMVVMAVALRMQGAICQEGRIVFGAIEEGPVRPTQTEQSMVGMVLDSDSIADIAKRAAREVRPLPHHGFTKGYIRKNIQVYLRRTLQQALVRLRRSPA